MFSSSQLSLLLFFFLFIALISSATSSTDQLHHLFVVPEYLKGYPIHNLFKAREQSISPAVSQPGFFYISFHQAEDQHCQEETAVAAIGIRTNTCLLSPDDAEHSWLYACDAGELIVKEYEGQVCNPLLERHTTTRAMTCSSGRQRSIVEEYEHDLSLLLEQSDRHNEQRENWAPASTSMNYKVSYRCLGGSVLPLWKDFYVENYHLDSACNDDYYSFFGVRERTCVRTEEGSSRLDYPLIQTFPDHSCEKQPSKATIVPAEECNRQGNSLNSVYMKATFHSSESTPSSKHKMSTASFKESSVTDIPTETPTFQPSLQQTIPPTEFSASPSIQPSTLPSYEPTMDPTFEITTAPTLSTNQPSREPTTPPTNSPTTSPTTPTTPPSLSPSEYPTIQPTETPSETPSLFPSFIPSTAPSIAPSLGPSRRPSKQPIYSKFPTISPSNEPTAIPTTSMPTTEDQFSLRPSPAPSITPSFAPSTLAPTLPAVVITVAFNVTQGLSGMSVDEYMANEEENNAAFAHTAASQLDGVSEDDIDILSVTADTTQSAAIMQASQARNMRKPVEEGRKLKKLVLLGSDDAVIILYQVVLPDATSAGYTNASQAYNSLVQQLTSSVESGAFDADLSSYAQSVGLSSLANTTSSTPAASDYVETVTYTTEDDDGGDTDDGKSHHKHHHHRHRLTYGELVGTVVGSFFGAVLILALAYLAYIYYQTHRTKQSATIHVEDLHGHADIFTAEV